MAWNFSNLRGDVFGGVTAAVVALPLALAFGVASGAGPIAGLYGAIIVGFFAAVFGGTASQISGPTGPMVVVFAGVYVALSDNPQLVFTTVVLAGLFMIAFGLLRLGDYIRLVPYPVISGFMSGIGCIIIILQLGRLVGHDTPGGTLMALAAVPEAVLSPNLAALAIGVISLVTVFFWPSKLGKFIPGPLAALLICTPLATFLPDVPVLGAIPSGLPEFHLPVFDRATAFLMVETALILAALGSIDSLLTSLVADNMTRTRHSSNRELVGQGIGNALAGLFGAIPGAGATMRTVVNIRTGGRTRLSGALHSVLLLAVVLGLGPLASKIPHAALAGILVKVGFDIIDWTYLKRAHRGPRWDLALMTIVLALTVFVDLITAVGVGVVLASLAFIQQMAHSQIDLLRSRKMQIPLNEEEEQLLASCGDRIMLFDFGGPLSFGAAADLGHHVRERVEEGTAVLILDFTRVPFLDVSSARAVDTVACDAKASGRVVLVAGLNAEQRSVLSGLNADHCLPSDGYFPDRVSALRAAADRWPSSPEARQDVLQPAQ